MYIINELKQNLKKYSGRKLITFKSYEMQELETISKLDIEQNEKDFINFRTKILNDKYAINVLPLYQDYCIGWLYDIIKNKCENDQHFFQYCKKAFNFNISENEINTYLNFYYLVLDFPIILLSDISFTKINKYLELIRNSVNNDTELKKLLKTPFICY